MKGVHWIGGHDEDFWFIPQNWEGGQLPVPGETALLNGPEGGGFLVVDDGVRFTRVIDTTVTMSIIGDLSVGAGSTLDDVSVSTWFMNGAGALGIEGSSVSNGHVEIGRFADLSIATHADFVVTGQLALDGAFLDGGGRLDTYGTTEIAPGIQPFPGVGVYGAVEFTGAMRWVNHGTVFDGGGVSGVSGSTKAEVIDNVAGATYIVEDDSGPPSIPTNDPRAVLLPGSFVFGNAGLLETRSGSASLAGILRNIGEIRVAPSATLVLEGGGRIGGTIDGGGTLALADLTYSFDRVTVRDNTEVDLRSGTIDLAPGEVIPVFTSLSGTVADIVQARVTFDTVGTTTINALAFAGDVVWRNAGLALIGPGGMTLGTGANGLNVAGGTIEIGATSPILPGTDDGGTLRNVGVLMTTSATAEIGFTLINDAQLVTDGTLTLLGGGTIDGTISGGGTVLLAGGVFEVPNAHVQAGTALVLAGGTLALPEGFEGPPEILDVALAAGTVSGFGTLVTDGTASGVVPAGFVTVTLQNGVTWKNLGLAAVDRLVWGVGTGPLPSPVVGIIQNEASGTLQIATSYDAGGQNGTIVNAGILSAADNVANAQIVSDLINTGTILLGTNGTDTQRIGLFGSGNLGGTVAGTGILALYGGMYSAGGLSISNGVVLDVQGATLEISSQTTLSGFADVTGGLLQLDRTTLTAASGLNLTTIAGTSNSTIISGGGTLVTDGVSDVRVSDGASIPAVVLEADWRNDGIVTAEGQIVVGYDHFVNTAGGTLNFTADAGGIVPEAGLVDANDILNNPGLIEKTGGIGTSVIGVAMTNSGTVEAASGTLDLARSLDGSGTVRIDAGSVLEANGIGAGQSIVFVGPNATLQLDTNQSITTAIAGLAVGDAFDLRAVSGANAMISGDTLTVTPTVGAALAFVSASLLTGDAAMVSGDGAGGTLVKLVASHG